MPRFTDKELKLRKELAQIIAKTIHGRMHYCGVLPGPYNPNYAEEEGLDESRSQLTLMSAYDILDVLARDGYSIVKK